MAAFGAAIADEGRPQQQRTGFLQGAEGAAMGRASRLYLAGNGSRILTDAPCDGLEGHPAAQASLNFAFGFGRGDIFEPFVLDLLVARRENLNLVAALEMVHERHQFMIDLGADAMRAQERVDAESKVKGGGVGRHRLDFALGREDDDFRRKEIELDGVEQVEVSGCGSSRISLMVCNHPSILSSSGWLTPSLLLYFQWAATPCSSMSSIRCERI